MFVGVSRARDPKRLLPGVQRLHRVVLSSLRWTDGVAILSRTDDDGVATTLLDDAPDAWNHSDVPEWAVLSTVRKYDASPSDRRARFATVLDEASPPVWVV